MLLFACVAGIAVWRTYDDQQRNRSLERRSAAVLALEDAGAQAFVVTIWAVASAFAEDPSSLRDLYREEEAPVRESLGRARAELVAVGDKQGLAALDELREQADELAQELEGMWGLFVTAGRDGRIEAAEQNLDRLCLVAMAAITDLNELVEEQRSKLAAERAAADRAADVTLWLLLGFSTAAFVSGATAMTVLGVSVVRPLASLRASVRAIASGDLEARAEVSGPEEVASLARDFNVMVAERVRTQEALWESEEHYGRLLEYISDGIAVVDREWRYVMVNDSMARFLGMPKGELVGTKVTDLFPDFEQTRFFETYQRVMETRRSASVVGEYTFRDGRKAWFEVRVYPVPEGVLRIISDITERKKAEEELRESEEKYRRVVEDSIDGIAIAQDLEVRFVNRALLRMYGYESEAEMVGRRFTEFLAPEYREITERRVGAGNASECAPGHFEQRGVRKGGGAFPIEVSVGTIAYDGDQAYQVVIRDITERKRAEEALRESEQRLREVLEASRDWVYKHNLQTGTYDYISPSVFQVTGFTPEEFVAMGFEGAQTRVHPEDLPRHRAHLERLLSGSGEGGMLPTIEYRWRRKDGEYRWLSDNRAVIRGRDGRPVARVGTIRDITEQKRAEEDLRESEERFRELSEAALEGIAIHDKGRILEANQALATMFGYGLAEIIGMHAVDLTAPESRDLISQRILSGYLEPFEAIGLRKECSTFPVIVHGRPMPYRGRTVSVTAIRDITALKQVEEALERAREDLEAKVEQQVARGNPYGLTFRELTVLHLVAAGRADKEIAHELGISPLTAHKHLTNILAKMGAASRTEASVRATREGLLD